MKRYIIPLVLGFVFLVAGCSYIYIEFLNLEFVDEVVEHSYKEKQVVYQFDIDNNGYYRFIADNTYIKKEVSEKLKNQIQVNVAYYPELSEVSYYENSIYESKPVKNVIFYMNLNEEINNVKNFSKLFGWLTSDLRDKTLHNYQLLIKPQVTVTVPKDREEDITIIEDNDWMDGLFEKEEEQDD